MACAISIYNKQSKQCDKFFFLYIYIKSIFYFTCNLSNTYSYSVNKSKHFITKDFHANSYRNKAKHFIKDGNNGTKVNMATTC